MNAREEFLSQIIISPACAPFWESEGSGLVVFLEPDIYPALGVAVGLQIVGHETRLRAGWSVDFVADDGTEDDPRTLFLGRRAAEADVLGVTFSNYSVLPRFFRMMRRMGIPVLSRERGLYDAPFIAAGGLAAVNPAPLEPFVDALVVGEGGLAMPALVDRFRKAKQKRMSRAALEESLAEIPGVYMPARFRFEYEGESLRRISPSTRIAFQRLEDVPGTRRSSLFMKPHNGIVLADYSCRHKCNFCLMSYARGAYSYQGRAAIQDYLAEFDAIGATTVTLSAASITNLPDGDFSGIVRWTAAGLKSVRPVIRSVRPDHIAGVLSSLDQRELHLAPETASDLIRCRVLGKTLRNSQFLKALSRLEVGTVNHVRLFRLVGIPGETREDRSAYVDLVADALRFVDSVQINVNPLFPQPGTPIQTMAPIGVHVYQDYCREMERDIEQVRPPGKRVKVNPLSPVDVVVQSLANTGDRRAGLVIHDGFRKGDTLEAYVGACAAAGVDGRSHFSPGFSGLPPWAMISLETAEIAQRRRKLMLSALETMAPERRRTLQDFFPAQAELWQG